MKVDVRIFRRLIIQLKDFVRIGRHRKNFSCIPRTATITVLVFQKSTAGYPGGKQIMTYG